jgi:hypothetical protein
LFVTASLASQLTAGLLWTLVAAVPPVRWKRRTTSDN